LPKEHSSHAASQSKSGAFQETEETPKKSVAFEQASDLAKNFKTKKKFSAYFEVKVICMFIFGQDAFIFLPK